MLKTLFYNIIVHSKYGLQGAETTFDFKYVPEYSTITELGECVEEKATHSYVETRNRNSFLVAIAVFGVGTWVASRVASSVVRAIW